MFHHFCITANAHVHKRNHVHSRTISRTTKFLERERGMRNLEKLCENASNIDVYHEQIKIHS